ncbi:MAG: 30S ribosomal protein S20 [Syntrophorhabdaceae bacterium]|nr:30S ribosomal protein S20 [Syntrophorhabdaceae bacterium]
MRKNKSAIKRTKQSEARRLRNSHVKTTMKTQIKKALSAADTKDTENLDALFVKAVSQINKAASKGVIHKNNASRKVSRLAKKVNRAAQAKG